MKRNTNGVRIVIRNRRTFEEDTQKLSAFSLARHFGIISPKVSTSSVIIPVLMAAPASPKSFMQKTVATEEQPIFTMLFPIRIVVKALSKFSTIFRQFFARLSPRSERYLRRIVLTVENAVSIDEKNADKNIQTIIMISISMSYVSKLKSLHNTNFKSYSII